MYRSQCLVEVVSLRWRKPLGILGITKKYLYKSVLKLDSWTDALFLLQNLIKQFFNWPLGNLYPELTHTGLTHKPLINLDHIKKALSYFSPCMKQSYQSYLLYLYILTFKDRNWNCTVAHILWIFLKVV